MAEEYHNRRRQCLPKSAAAALLPTRQHRHAAGRGQGLVVGDKRPVDGVAGLVLNCQLVRSRGQREPAPTVVREPLLVGHAVQARHPRAAAGVVDLVSITAERKQEKEVKDGEKVLRTERYFGKVSRSFQLGQEIDEARASAKFNDGVLELALPKKAEAQAKRLTIE